MQENLVIRETKPEDLEYILDVEKRAFGEDEEAELVENLLNDSTAKPSLSLLAFDGEKPIGHILFTKILMKSRDDIKLSLLAPLAVIPEAQNKGVGGKLINKGLEFLAKSGVNMVFVLGHPGYYPKYGFKPAGLQKFPAPYPILEKNSDAWMMQTLSGYNVDNISGKIICAKALDKEEYWRE